MLRVCETFVSLAGESDWQGLVSAFLRFAGCDVDCDWCDTAYARAEAGTEVAVEDLVALCHSYGARRVTLTGGEPLLQEELPQLCNRLLEERFAVQLETSGTRLADRIDPRVMKVMDLKPPGANAKKGFHWGNLDLLGPQDELKFVLAGREDYDWALRIMRKCRLESLCPVVFSPVPGRLAPAELAQWMIADQLSCRLRLQLHKQLWPHDPRGR